MKVKKLEQLIKELKSISNRNRKLYELDVDLIAYDNKFHSIINTLLKEMFTKEAYNWFEWYCFEKDFGERIDIKAWDKEKNEICKDINGLHKLMFD
jgi:hypothetical protein